MQVDDEVAAPPPPKKDPPKQPLGKPRKTLEFPRFGKDSEPAPYEPKVFSFLFIILFPMFSLCPSLCHKLHSDLSPRILGLFQRSKLYWKALKKTFPMMLGSLQHLKNPPRDEPVMNYPSRDLTSHNG